MSVRRHDEIPAGTLIAACRPESPGERAETHLDCYTADVGREISLSEFVEAFYTTLPFRMERWILAVAVRRPSTNEQAGALASASIDRFAAWSVEDRTANEILMRDMANKTKSWLMVEPAASGNGTRLYFGSVVTASIHPHTGNPALGWAFRLFMPLHGIYSRVLLAATRANLSRAVRQ